MKTVLIFGGSIVNGVGGDQGGWADKLKLWLHQEMFGRGGVGQICTVHELGIPGNTANDLVDRFAAEADARISSNDPDDTYIIFSAGANDSRAVDQPKNYFCTPDEFVANVRKFVRLAKERSNHVLCVGLLPVDEAKTNPKINPLSGGKSYFTNQRIKQFEDTLAELCKQEKVAHLPLFEAVPADWRQTCLIPDGMHPNNSGHEWIFSQVEPELRGILQ